MWWTPFPWDGRWDTAGIAYCAHRMMGVGAPGHPCGLCGHFSRRWASWDVAYPVVVVGTGSGSCHHCLVWWCGGGWFMQ